VTFSSSIAKSTEHSSLHRKFHKVGVGVQLPASYFSRKGYVCYTVFEKETALNSERCYHKGDISRFYSVPIGFVYTKQSINYDLTLRIFSKLIIHGGGIWIFLVSINQCYMFCCFADRASRISV